MTRIKLSAWEIAAIEVAIRQADNLDQASKYALLAKLESADAITLSVK